MNKMLDKPTKQPSPTSSDNSDTDSINIDKLVATFLANKRNTQSDPAETNSIGDCSLSENDGNSVLSKNPKFESESHKKRTIHHYFQQKLLSHLVKEPKEKSKHKAKKTTYHSRLLTMGLDIGVNGKMVQYTDYHAYNSDDSSNVSDNFESSLFYKYGMASRFVDSSLKQDLIYSRSTTNNNNNYNIKKKKKPIKGAEGRYKMCQITNIVCCVAILLIPNL